MNCVLVCGKTELNLAPDPISSGAFLACFSNFSQESSRGLYQFF